MLSYDRVRMFLLQVMITLCNNDKLHQSEHYGHWTHMTVISWLVLVLRLSMNTKQKEKKACKFSCYKPKIWYVIVVHGTLAFCQWTLLTLLAKSAEPLIFRICRIIFMKMRHRFLLLHTTNNRQLWEGKRIMQRSNVKIFYILVKKFMCRKLY